MYVRSLVAAEKRNAATNARTLVRQQQEALGLSLPGLARNRWRIGAPRSGVSAAKPPATAGGARSRFKVVTGGAAG